MANRDYASYSDEFLLKSFEQCNAQLLAIEFKTPKPGGKTDHDLMVAGLQGRIFVLCLYILIQKFPLRFFLLQIDTSKVVIERDQIRLESKLTGSFRGHCR